MLVSSKVLWLGLGPAFTLAGLGGFDSIFSSVRSIGMVGRWVNWCNCRDNCSCSFSFAWAVFLEGRATSLAMG